MLQITPQMKILVATKPADFRRGIDGLARLCQERLEQDPFTGAVFVFCNRKGTALKLLMYDGQGYWLCQKWLSRGRFSWWPVGIGSAEPSPRAGAAGRHTSARGHRVVRRLRLVEARPLRKTSTGPLPLAGRGVDWNPGPKRRVFTGQSDAQARFPDRCCVD